MLDQEKEKTSNLFYRALFYLSTIKFMNTKESWKCNVKILPHILYPMLLIYKQNIYTYYICTVQRPLNNLSR